MIQALSNPEADAAVMRKLAWNSGPMQRYAVALVRRAVGLYDQGRPYFNSDDAPEDCLPGDKTTIGAATRMLLSAGVITPYRQTIPELGIWGGIRRSSRRSNHGHRDPLYQITSRPIASEFLHRNGIELPSRQMEMQLG